MQYDLRLSVVCVLVCVCVEGEGVWRGRVVGCGQDMKMLYRTPAM